MRSNRNFMFFVLAFILVISIGTAMSVPEPAHEFYGNVSLEGVAAPVGTNISAYDLNQTLCGRFVVKNAGYYGLLSCEGDDLNTSSDEGADAGENISFWINSQIARTNIIPRWTSGYFSYINLEENHAPVLDFIRNRVLTAGFGFWLDINATDQNNDTLYYNVDFSNATLFSIELLTGVLNFTPLLEHVGNHTLNFTVSDGLEDDWQLVTFNIVPGYCGDAICTIYETSFSCPDDCEETPESSTGALPEGGSIYGGGAADLEQGDQGTIECAEDWECTEWTECSPAGIRTRNCTDKNKCGTDKNKPETSQKCDYGTCFDGVQNCHDGLCEDGIDCGGPCLPCEIFGEDEAAKLPIEEIPSGICGDGICSYGENCVCPSDCRSFSEFPWIWFLLAILILTILAIITLVILYLLKHKQKLNYKLFTAYVHRLILLWIILTVVIGLFASVCYFWWWCWPKIILWMFILLVINIIILAVIYVIYLYKTSYDAETKRKKLMVFLNGHVMQLKEVVSIEGRMIQQIEAKLVKTIYRLFKEKSEIIKQFQELIDIYNMIRRLEKQRKLKTGLFDLESEIVVAISELAKKDSYKSMLGENKELKQIDSDIQLVLEYLSRKHKLVMRIKRIREVLNRLEA